MKYKKIAAFFLVSVLIFSLVGCSSSVKIPKSAVDYIGVSYQKVIEELTKIGFTNISTEEVDDLSVDNISEENSVAHISINGNSNFEKDDSFEQDATIIVGYHTAQKISVPISSDDLQTADYLEIAQMFSEAGFTDVEAEVVFDRDPDTMELDFFNEVSIDHVTGFAQGDTYAFNTAVKIVCHLPYAKYDVAIHIDFIGNWIFNKYDVDYSIVSITDGTLQHGQDEDIFLRLKEGSYTLTFSERGTSSNNTDLTIDVSDDMEASYQLYCESDNIRIETLYIENKHAAGEGQAMVPDSASNLKYLNYQETVDKLEQAGFTNIKTDAVYDIVWGFTTEGTVASIMIGTATDFNRGDVFDADAPVVVTYHMKEENDPSKQQDEPNSPNDETPSTESNAVSYSTNDYETAKLGNTGVFSYVHRGQEYWIYWIIDFDEGYVYSFTDGNGNDSCDRTKIESGDLNSVLITTYRDGDDTWSYGFHFHYKNNPSKLIMQDNDGFEYEYSTTDLTSALEIRNSKTINDY